MKRKITINELKSLTKKIVQEAYGEYLKENENEFVAHGTYTVGNGAGYEVMLSDDGEQAKVRYVSDNGNEEPSDWMDIEYVDSDETLDSEPVIDPSGLNIPLSKVMRVRK